MWRRNRSGGKAKPEYATSKIAVWWDIKDCPIPDGYDARWVRPSIEDAFKELGYSGPVSITAYGDQTQTPGHVLQGLSSTGVSVAHNRPESTCALMYSDMVKWRGHNPPPATMMIISNQVEAVFSWDLVRLQQRITYNLFLAYSILPRAMLVLVTSAEWLWGNLLNNNKVETRSAPLVSGETSPMHFRCKSCKFNAQSPQKFKKHLSSYNHVREEAINPTDTDLTCVTETWGRNYPATPEYATAKILVWWNMSDCPIPEGYDARRVRPSLEAAFKNLGYSGSVSITAFGNLNFIPHHLLEGLSSTGVGLAHTRSDLHTNHMYRNMIDWYSYKPPPANIMVIADDLYPVFSTCLVNLLQRQKHNLFLAYSYRPNHKLSVLLTSAEWLWESLLVGVSDTRRHVLRKCSGSETDRSARFYCKMCFCDYKSLDDLMTHLSGQAHAQEDNRYSASMRANRRDKKIGPLVQYNLEHREQWKQWRREVEKRKPMRRAFLKGFRLLDNHLRLTNRPRARTYKKDW